MARDRGTTSWEDGMTRAMAPWRRWVAVVLVVLAALSTVITTASIWIRTTIFDTDRFMGIVQPALDEPALYDLLATRVSDDIILALDVEPRVSGVLTDVDERLIEMVLDALGVSDLRRAILSRLDRPSLTVLAAPIADALNTRITRIVEEFVTSDAFRNRVPGLVRQAHAASVALIRNDLADLPNVYIEDGEVRLNLIPIIVEAARLVVADVRDLLTDVTLPTVISDRFDEGRQQLIDALHTELPDEFGQVTLFRADKLTPIQDTVDRLDRLVSLLMLTTIVLMVGAIVLAPTRRRTVIHLAVGVVGGLVVGLIIVERIEAAILDQITGPRQLAVGHAVLTEVVGSLRSSVLMVAIGAALVGIIAVLLGRRPSATEQSNQTPVPM